jgi:hypothetical protein
MPHGRSGVGRRRIFRAQSEGLTAFFTLPVIAQVQGMLQFVGSRNGTIADAAPAEPAFVGIERNRRFAFFRIGHQYARTTRINAGVAAGTDRGIENYVIVRRHGIGDKVSFVIGVHQLPPEPALL